MRILGIDPGLASTGVGVIERDGDVWRMVTCADVKSSAGMALPRRLKRIYDLVATHIDENAPDAVAVESLFFAKNVRSAVMMAHGRGVALLAAERADIPIFEYSPLEIKQSVVGKGRATKEQVMQMVKLLLQLPTPPKSDHMADALACALAHAYRSRINERMTDPGQTPNSQAKELLAQARRTRKRRRA